MKKEEKNLSTEEKMLKSFKTCNEIITILEGIIIAAIIVGIISFINSCIEANFDMIEVRENVLDFIGYDENVINDITGYEAMETGSVYKSIYIIGFILQVISLVTILHLLRHILLDSIKQKTPFVEKNINRMNLIAIFSIFYSLRLVYFVIIIMVNQLFKYGYELQVESDELL